MKWTVSQLSIMIIYNSIWSILIQWIRVMIVRWQSDLLNTKEIAVPDSDQPYHKIKENIPHWEELENLWNYWIIHYSPNKLNLGI